MNSIISKLNKEFLFFDGAMGTMLQKEGLNAGDLPELFNIEKPDIIEKIHTEYLKAGADIITTNTFGANPLKFLHDNYSLEDVIKAAISCARKAIEKSGSDAKIALDIGPLGQLLEPVGTLKFEDAVEAFSEVVKIGTSCGVDLILIETMSDIYEAKAAVIAAKENCELPIFCTMTFSDNDRTLTGSEVATVVSVLEGLGVDALGLNCGTGPIQSIHLAEQFVKYSSTPVIFQPNAGMPKYKDGETYFDIDETQFSCEMKKIAQFGAGILGGCCGTTPEHIKLLKQKVKDTSFTHIEKKNFTIVSSNSKSLEIGRRPVIIGERINPTGKKKFKEALRENNIEYILNEAISQKELGCHALDVNVGIPEINEKEVMVNTIKELQSVVNLPLQIDSSDSETLEAALRIYNGKALVNSVNGKKSEMEKIFPIVKKYGGVLIGLTLDENGIPSSCEERFKIAENIVNTAENYGIDKKDIIIDTLVLTASAQQAEVIETIKALRMVKEKLGVNTVLGVSNVSFGLPNRELINATFLSMALSNGLSSCIINPKSELMTGVVSAFNVLSDIDKNSCEYIEKFSNSDFSVTMQKGENIAQKGMTQSTVKDLAYCIKSGLKEETKTAALYLIENGIMPMEIIEKHIIPALNEIGDAFEKGTMFLPQLILSAQVSKIAFDVIKEKFPRQSGETSKGDIVIATVKGDVHDIGKNIVKLLLQNYGYNVIDLGKNVDIDVVVDCVKEKNIKLLGLSALMTTTVVNMADTITEVKKACPDCRIMVGGAVLTYDYAMSINADYYSEDAMGSVAIANEVFGI